MIIPKGNSTSTYPETSQSTTPVIHDLSIRPDHKQYNPKDNSELDMIFFVTPITNPAKCVSTAHESIETGEFPQDFQYSVEVTDHIGQCRQDSSQNGDHEVKMTDFKISLDPACKSEQEETIVCLNIVQENTEVD